MPPRRVLGCPEEKHPSACWGVKRDFEALEGRRLKAAKYFRLCVALVAILFLASTAVVVVYAGQPRAQGKVQRPQPFRVEPHDFRFAARLDLDNMNRLVDDLEAAAAAQKVMK